MRAAGKPGDRADKTNEGDGYHECVPLGTRWCGWRCPGRGASCLAPLPRLTTNLRLSAQEMARQAIGAARK
jgi:hypothetical protein